MGSMKYNLLLLNLLAAFGGGVYVTKVHSQENSLYPWYIGVDVDYVSLTDACDKSALECNDKSFGYGIKGGYVFENSWGMELGYHRFDDLDAHYPSGTVTSDISSVSALVSYRNVLFGNMVGMVKGGAAYSTVHTENTKSNLTESNWSPTVAAGVEHRITDRLGASVEYRYINNVVNSGLHSFYVGLNYYFGGGGITPVIVPQPGGEPRASVASEVITEEPRSQFNVKTPGSINSLELRTESIYFDTSAVEVVIDTSLLKELQNSEGSIFIVGHTDSVGSSLSNKKLSYKRAKAVADTLVRFGVEENRILIRARGEEAPIADNQTSTGREANRRVEVQYRLNTNLQ